MTPGCGRSKPVHDIFQIMCSSWYDWQKRDPANWQDWYDWQDHDDWQEQGNRQKKGSNNSWRDDGCHKKRKREAENKKAAAIKARHDKRDDGCHKKRKSEAENKNAAAINARHDKREREAEQKADPPAHFPPDAYEKWQAGINNANACTRSNSGPPIGKAQKKTPPPSAQIQTAMAAGPRNMLMHQVVNCMATVNANTLHSNEPSGSSASCVNSGLDLAPRGTEALLQFLLAETSHSDEPCSATNHPAETSHSDEPCSATNASARGRAVAPKTIDLWRHRDIELWWLPGAGSASQNLDPPEGSYQCFTCGECFPIASCLANLRSPHFDEFYERSGAKTLLDRWTCQYGEKHWFSMEVLAQFEEQHPWLYEVPPKDRAIMLLQRLVPYLTLYQPDCAVRACCFFCAGKFMKNDPWHFVDNRTWKHLCATWKTKSVTANMWKHRAKHLCRLKKEIESLKFVLEGKRKEYLKNQGETSIPTVIYTHLVEALESSSSLAAATDWVVFFGPLKLGLALIYGIPRENWEVAWRDPRNLVAMTGWSTNNNLDETGFYPLSQNDWWLMQPNPEPGTTPDDAHQGSYQIKGSSTKYRTDWHSPISLTQYRRGYFDQYRLLTLGLDGTRCICGYVGKLTNAQQDRVKVLAAAALLKEIYMLDTSTSPVPMPVTEELIIEALKFLYQQSDVYNKNACKNGHCRTLFAVHPASTTMKDTHHPVCHDEALSLRVAGLQVRGLVVDKDQTPVWDKQMVDNILGWLSTFFNFEEDAIKRENPAATTASIKYFKEAQQEMHDLFARLDVSDLILED